MKIAIVTGASSGIGREFVIQIADNYHYLDEIWVIARNRQALKKLQEEVPIKLVILPLDLRKKIEQRKLKEKLKASDVKIKLLVNAAGTGKIGYFTELSADNQKSMIRLNCEALTTVTYLCIPYMRRSSRIIQMASAAAFVPQPGFAVYAATKSYVLSFSRALRAELLDRGISVTAVCPGPVDTPFFEKAETLHEMSEFKKSVMVNPENVVTKAICDAAIGRGISIYGKNIQAFRIGCKLLPHAFLIWLTEYMNHFE